MPAPAPGAGPCPFCGETVPALSGTCPHCQEDLSPSMAPGPCPFCGEPVPALALSCPHCEEDLSPSAAREIADRAAAATHEDAAAGRFQGVPADAFRRFRRGTRVAGGLAVLLITSAVLLSGKAEGPGAAAVLALIPGVIAALFALAYLFMDLGLAAPAKLTTAKRTAETYLKCLRERRWEYAYHLIAPRGREGPRRRMASERLRTAAATIVLDSPDALRAYWTPLLGASVGTVRTAQQGPLSIVNEGEDRATVRTTITVTAYPQWVNVLILMWPLALLAYVLLRKSQVLDVDLPVIRVQGRWYLLDAVPQAWSADVASD